MQLTEKGLIAGKEQWLDAGYHIPQYDHAAMVQRTKEEPYWLHFGAGNIFRAFQANVVEQLLNEGVLERGIIAVGGHEAMEQLFWPHDNYTVLATLKADGTVEKTIVGGVAETLTMDAGYPEHFDRLKEIFMKDSLQMVSFTITEKGYSLLGSDGAFRDDVMADFENGPANPISYMGKITSFLYARYQAGMRPLAMVSMDNCSHNGTILYNAIIEYVNAWIDQGYVKIGFLEYVSNPLKVSFPWSMIDKITPRPDKAVESFLEKDKIEELNPIISKRGTYIAPFVNAEESQYLVIEDVFPNGRPELEKGGIIFAERETVEKVERMKVCTCLNPLHTVLAIFGCLLDFDKICDEMNDDTLKKMVEEIGYREGLPVVTDPGVLDPKEFIDTVINVRLANPFMPDTPQRIATDTSQKLAIRFGETVKEYQERGLALKDLKLIPLVYAGWLRYLIGVDDQGKEMELSDDPMLETLCPVMKQFRLGEVTASEETLRPILKNKEIFGIDLYEIGMTETVCKYFEEMLAGPGAVRKTLDKYVK